MNALDPAMLAVMAKTGARLKQDKSLLRRVRCRSKVGTGAQYVRHPTYRKAHAELE